MVRAGNQLAAAVWLGALFISSVFAARVKIANTVKTDQGMVANSSGTRLQHKDLSQGPVAQDDAKMWQERKEGIWQPAGGKAGSGISQSGMQCLDACTAGLSDCYYFPRCTVKRSRFDPLGLFSERDWCTFPKYDKYEDLLAKDKLKILEERITKWTTPAKLPSAIGLLKGIFFSSVKVSFDQIADVLPGKRIKAIHSQGVVAAVTWESLPGHDYTGIFQGGEHGLIRFSSAKKPEAGGKLTPGLGIKFLRDGRPSANFVAMPSLEGQECSDSNFFHHDFVNHVPNPKQDPLVKALVKKFSQASACPSMVGLSDFASPADGVAGKFPWKLILTSNLIVDVSCKDFPSGLSSFEAVKKHDTLFEVKAFAFPGDKDPKVIGKIKLEGALRTSTFGDNTLFFKHQYIEDDLALEPTWIDMIEDKAAVGCAEELTVSRPPSSDTACGKVRHILNKIEEVSSDIQEEVYNIEDNDINL